MSEETRMMMKMSVEWLLVEFQAAGPPTVKLRDPYRYSREIGIIRSQCEDDCPNFRVMLGKLEVVSVRL